MWSIPHGNLVLVRVCVCVVAGVRSENQHVARVGGRVARGLAGVWPGRIDFARDSRTDSGKVIMYNHTLFNRCLTYERRNVSCHVVK